MELMAQPVDGEPCHHSHEPRFGLPHARRVAQLPPQHRILNHVLGVVNAAEHAIRNTKETGTEGLEIHHDEVLDGRGEQL